ncbi:MAG: glucosamine-6-phosphate deaminase [Tannerellaceae bacterium]|jgi:glucosamine-6-phosphate deaminase|nr:glucosamine-6-phosphate deaminase [Tannerellaceae bacterium]
MRLIIQADYERLSEWAASYIVGRIGVKRSREEGRFVLGLPTGSSPLGVYKKLVEVYRGGGVSFKEVETFNMDEYVGLGAGDAESYHSFMWKHLFSEVDIQEGQVHILDGRAADLEKECAAYEARIREVGGVDLFLGGIGGDGHIAFNEPGSSLSSRTRVKTLTEETIRANARFFGNEAGLVPRRALTVGVGTILEAREVVILVNGAEKARALREAVEGGVSQRWPITALQLHERGIIVADEAACGELKVSTYRYYKEIEQGEIK